MYCKNCGKMLDSKANFCEYCGEKVEREREEKRVYCTFCGKEILESDVICPYCMKKVKKNLEFAGLDSQIKLLCILSFLFPIMGLVLWIIFKDNEYEKSQKILNWTIMGFVVWTVLKIVEIMFGILFG